MTACYNWAMVAAGNGIATPMTPRSAWSERLRPPFTAVGDHVGADLPGGRALFLTRRGGVSGPPFDGLNVGLATNDDGAAVDENRERVARLIGIPRSRWLESTQVHGSEVRTVGELPAAGARPAADGVVTTLADVAAVVLTADCLPVALIAPEAVAMVHAGWRGLAAGILRNAVVALREAGADGDVHVAIGPGIGACCYEVDTTVQRAFAGYGSVGAPPGGRVDLKRIARLQLQAAGVGADAIHDVDVCTMCAPGGLLYSHRRGHGADPRDTGRQASAVWRVGGS